MQQITMYLNCIIEESDEIKSAKGESEIENDGIDFKPRNANAIDLRNMPIDTLHKTLASEFGTSEGN